MILRTSTSITLGTSQDDTFDFATSTALDTGQYDSAESDQVWDDTEKEGRNDQDGWVMLC